MRGTYIQTSLVKQNPIVICQRQKMKSAKKIHSNSEYENGLMSNHPIFSWPQTNYFPDVLNIGRYFTNNKFAESCRMGSIFGLLPATVSPQILQYPLPPRQTSACSGHLQYSTSTRALCIRSRVFAIITNLQTGFMAFNQSFNRCCFSSKTDFQLEVVLSLQLTLEKCISAKFDYLVLPRMPIDTITTALCCYLF